MKGSFAMLRRSAVAMGIALTMLVAVGTGAGAATKVQLSNYTASAMAQTLRLDVKVASLDLHQAISFSSALAQWDKSAKSIKGSSTGRVLEGTIPSEVVSSAVNKASAKASKDGSMASISIPNTAAPLVKVGVGTTTTRAASAVSAATSYSRTVLAEIEVLGSGLAATPAGGAIEALEDTLNGSGDQAGLLDEINKQLAALGTGIAIGDVKVSTGHVLKIGIMESVSETGYTSGLRTAHAMNKLAGVSLLNGLVKADVIEVDARASLSSLGTSPKATPVTKILGLTIGNQAIDLTSGTISVAGKTLTLPVELKSLLNDLVVDIAGVKVEALRNVKETKAGHAFAQANSLRIAVEPALTAGNPLFSVVLQAPVAQAGVDAGSTQVLGRRLSRTGVADTGYLIIGPVLLGAAVLVRRFALSK